MLAYIKMYIAKIFLIIIGIYAALNAYQFHSSDELQARIVGSTDTQQFHRIPMLQCIKDNNCSQEELINYVYIINLQSNDNNNSKLWLTISIISLLLSILPIQGIMLEEYKKIRNRE